jgi:hypothetical protein
VIAAPQAGRAQQVRDPIAPGLKVGVTDRLAGRSHDDGRLVGVIYRVLPCKHPSPNADGDCWT